jgi:uncharacterized membrane protein YphA (DoxX/SURF4 family)
LDVVILVLRVALGGVFLAAGLLKVSHPEVLAATIAAFRLLPQPVIAPLAIALPYFEMILGGYLIVGLFTRGVALIAAAQLAGFAAAIASVVVRGIPTSCGCFGPNDTAPASWVDVARDLVLAALALAIALRAPGSFALDRRLNPKSFPVSERT